MKRKFLAITFIVALLFGSTGNVSAQSYRFKLEKEIVHVFWNTDGTVSLDYTFTFINQPGAHAIDFVDVGMPNRNFELDTVKADAEGKPLTVSTLHYQGDGWGFAIVLGSKSIRAGETGTVHVYIGRVDKVLYLDTNEKNDVSAVFAPTYFGSEYGAGFTNMTVAFHLPPGATYEDSRYHQSPLGFSQKPKIEQDADDRVTYTWASTVAHADYKYLFGASFPKSVLSEDAFIVSPTTTRGLSDRIGLMLDNIGILLGIIILVFFVGVFIYSRRVKLQYLPPTISIEGNGIKRGLTAVEVAILMQMPLDNMMTMILFGLIKKGAAEVVTRKPLVIKPAKHFPDDLHQYELDFLGAFGNGESEENNWLVKDKRKNVLEEMTVHLIRSVSEKMRGFSRQETIDYYKGMVEKAWRQVQEADTPKVKTQILDEYFEWMMLDRSFDRRAERAFDDSISVPDWWSNFDSTWSVALAENSASSVSHQHQTPTGMSVADFSASVVGSVQTFSKEIIGNINDFASRITNVTNPPPSKPYVPPNYTDGDGRSVRDIIDSLPDNVGNSGGYDNSCACACAGCACACAGGGR